MGWSNSKSWGAQDGWYKVPITGSVSFAYVTSSQTLAAGSGNTLTATSVPIGTAFATRRVVIAIGGSSGFNGPIVSATIGGIAATIHADTTASSPGDAIISADVPTGTTATVVFNMTGAQFFNYFVNAYTIDDATLVSTTPLISSGTSSSASSVVGSSVAGVNGGCVIGSFSLDSGNSGFAASPYTIDASVAATGWFSGALGSTGSISPTGTWTGGATASAILSATVWR